MREDFSRFQNFLADIQKNLRDIRSNRHELHSTCHELTFFLVIPIASTPNRISRVGSTSQGHANTLATLACRRVASRCSLEQGARTMRRCRRTCLFGSRLRTHVSSGLVSPDFASTAGSEAIPALINKTERRVAKPSPHRPDPAATHAPCRSGVTEPGPPYGKLGAFRPDFRSNPC